MVRACHRDFPRRRQRISQPDTEVQAAGDVAMIRGDDQERVVPLPDGLQPLDEAPELIVLLGHRLVVEAAGEIEVGGSTEAGLLERVGVG